MKEASGMLRGGGVLAIRVIVPCSNRQGKVLQGQPPMTRAATSGEHQRRGNWARMADELDSADGRITGCRHAPWLSIFFNEAVEERIICIKLWNSTIYIVKDEGTRPTSGIGHVSFLAL